MPEDLPTRPYPGYRFTLTEKLRIVDAFDACVERGAKTALTRRLGLRENTIREWANARDAGTLSARRLEHERDGEDYRWMTIKEKQELARLRRENRQLRSRLEKSEAAVEILGKASALLESMAKSAGAAEPLLEEGPTPRAPVSAGRPGTSP
jgi:plasmid maintenance system antidote protein VapI